MVGIDFFKIAFTSFFFIFPFLIFGLVIFSIIFWILMLVDVVKRDFKKEDDKTMWVLIIALTGFVGALIYYFMIKRKVPKKKTKNKK
ncbi:MAG: PLDc N-terminal domain-containing protein [Candidatus Pacebacteria bacterium]|nr:PLDc N-terminal domain-containing protein [Candidatus Paceibacterota bacterium]